MRGSLKRRWRNDVASDSGYNSQTGAQGLGGEQLEIEEKDVLGMGFGDAWVAQSLKRPTLDFHAGLDLRFMGSAWSLL